VLEEWRHHFDMSSTSASYFFKASVCHTLIHFSQSAVVRGAALRGLEGIAPRVKHARRHYGISLGMPFRAGIDPEESAYLDSLDDSKLCRGRMQWLISKVSD
jgi:hypothetical protein